MIVINFDKAKEVAHEKRRSARTAEFAPYDEIILKQIPGEIKAAEKKRKEIRTKYEKIQEEVDAATNLDELKSIIEKL
jgi:hypothetical protein